MRGPASGGVGGVVLVLWALVGGPSFRAFWGPIGSLFFFHECGRRVGGVPRSSGVLLSPWSRVERKGFSMRCEFQRVVSLGFETRFHHLSKPAGLGWVLGAKTFVGQFADKRLDDWTFTVTLQHLFWDLFKVYQYQLMVLSQRSRMPTWVRTMVNGRVSLMVHVSDQEDQHQIILSCKRPCRSRRTNRGPNWFLLVRPLGNHLLRR